MRIRPLTDDKILTSWNGLALTALCRGYQVTGDRRYLEAAIMNAGFVSRVLWNRGELTHSYRQGKHSTGQFLEDYAYYVRGLIDLYESDHSRQNERWLKLASELTDRATVLFLDGDGTFYLTPADQDDLIMRPRNESDGSLPAPGSIMISNLFKLNRLTGSNRFYVAGEEALHMLSGKMERNPSAMTSAMLALDYYLLDKIEIVLVGTGPERDSMLRVLHSRFLPNRVIAVSDDGNSSLPLLEGRQSRNGEVRAFVCRNSVCRLPAETADELREQLQDL